MDFSRFYEVVVARYSGNEVDAANVDVSRLIFFSLSHFYRGLNDVDSRREIFPLPLIYIYINFRSKVREFFASKVRAQPIRNDKLARSSDNYSSSAIDLEKRDRGESEDIGGIHVVAGVGRDHRWAKVRVVLSSYPAITPEGFPRKPRPSLLSALLVLNRAPFSPPLFGSLPLGGSFA